MSGFFPQTLSLHPAHSETHFLHPLSRKLISVSKRSGHSDNKRLLLEMGEYALLDIYLLVHQ